MTTRFHRLPVTAVDRLTDDSVALTLAVPPHLRAEYRYAPGQHVSLRTRAEPRGNGGTRKADSGTEIRRTYSLCSPAPGSEGPSSLRIGVRLVEGGVFSLYALKEITVGDELEVMTPAGRFTLEPAPGHYAAVVGGSGVTPVLSIATTLLEREPTARFCLIRSDRTAASTMFLEEVADLKDRYPDRFQLVTVLSREEQEAGLPSGRLGQERLTALLPSLLPVREVAGWYLCGPYGLVGEAARALRSLGVPQTRVHEEIFHVDTESDARTSTRTSSRTNTRSHVRSDTKADSAAAHSTLTARLDGRSGTCPVKDGESLLDALLRNRPDAPYSCRGGVCGTCRAFLVSGEVRMDRNYALEQDETEAGYVLACQSHPATEEVELDFDR